MDTLELDKKGGTYGHGLHRISVEKTIFHESNSFEMFVHSFLRQRSFHVFQLKYGYQITTVFTETKFYGNNVKDLEVIFSIYCPNMPLIFGIGTIDGNTAYYPWREFYGKYSVNLHNYEPIKSNALLAELTKANLEMNSETFKITSTYPYLEIMVSEDDFEEDFKNITHESYKTYSFLNLEATLKSNFENYNSSSFNSTKLSKLSVYFHKNDSQYFYPLLLEFNPKPNFNTVYYQLMGIDTQLNFKKLNKTTKLGSDGLAKCLNETYLKLHSKFDPKPNNTLLSYYNPTTLGVTPPFKDEISSVTYLQLNLFAVFGSLFVLAGIFYFLYQFYIKMKFKYY